METVYFIDKEPNYRGPINEKKLYSLEELVDSLWHYHECNSSWHVWIDGKAFQTLDETSQRLESYLFEYGMYPVYIRDCYDVEQWVSWYNQALASGKVSEAGEDDIPYVKRFYIYRTYKEIAQATADPYFYVMLQYNQNLPDKIESHNLFDIQSLWNLVSSINPRIMVNDKVVSTLEDLYLLSLSEDKLTVTYQYKNNQTNNVSVKDLKTVTFMRYDGIVTVDCDIEGEITTIPMKMENFKKFIKSDNHTTTAKETPEVDHHPMEYPIDTESILYKLSSDCDESYMNVPIEDLWKLEDVLHYLWSEKRMPGELEIFFNGCSYKSFGSFVMAVEQLVALSPTARFPFFIRNINEMREFFGNGYVEEDFNDFDIPYEEVLYLIPLHLQGVSIDYKNQ